MLNCICEFNPVKNFKCYNANVPVYFAARRLTSDMWSQVLNNFYMRPMYRRPYYFIHNNNQTNSIPTNPYTANKPANFSAGMTNESGLGYGTDLNQNYTTTNSNLSRTELINGTSHSLIELEIGNRYGNASNVRMEIRYGLDDTLFKLTNVYVDYLKVPQNIRLTQDQLDLVEDTSQIIEFPDYVCYEIINELTKLLMENGSDPRLQTNIPVNQSIAPPAQAVQQPQAQQQLS